VGAPGGLFALRGDTAACSCTAPRASLWTGHGATRRGRLAGRVGGVHGLRASEDSGGGAGEKAATGGTGGGVSATQPTRRDADQRYQVAVLQGLVASGQLVPGGWAEGNQFKFSDAHRFGEGEVVVVAGADLKTRFARVIGASATGASAGAGGGAGVLHEVEVYRAGGERQVAEVAAALIGKVLPLSRRELEQLDALAPPVKFVAPGAEPPAPAAGVVASLRRLVDVDKQAAPPDALPFQPMLSRTGAPGAPGARAPEAGTQKLDAPPRRIGSVGWGELDGWWSDEALGEEVFEVLLRRPLGLELSTDADGGVRVARLERGGHAERAGMAVGDRVEVPGGSPRAAWRGDSAAVSAAVAAAADGGAAADAPVRLRFARASQGERAAPRIWREQGGGGGAAVELVVRRPIGARLAAVPGRGVFVEELVPGGNAERAGLLVGDRVVDARAAPGGSEEDAAALVRELQAAGGAPVTLALERGAPGRALMARQRERFQAGSIDATLTAKVKRNLMGALPGALRSMQGDAEELAEEPAGRVLRINVDLAAWRARTAMRRGDAVAGEALYRECMAMDPADGRAYLGLAKMHERARLPVKAREMLVAGVKAAPRNAHLLQALACLEERLGQPEKARVLLARATSEDPRHAASWVSRGKMEERAGRADTARQCYARAATADPDSYYAWHCLATLEAREGNMDTARALFRRGEAANPHNAATLQAWGVMESKAGFHTRAVELFRKGAKANPRSTWVLQAWAVAEWDQGNTTRAAQLFAKAARLRPDDGGVYQAYAVRLHRQGRLREARRWFADGAAAAKADVSIWQAWALMEAEAGDITRARELFQEGVWQAGASGRARMDMLWQAWALLEAREGDIEVARKYFERAIQASLRPPPPLAPRPRPGAARRAPPAPGPDRRARVSLAAGGSQTRGDIPRVGQGGGGAGLGGAGAGALRARGRRRGGQRGALGRVRGVLRAHVWGVLGAGARGVPAPGRGRDPPPRAARGPARRAGARHGASRAAGRAPRAPRARAVARARGRRRGRRGRGQLQGQVGERAHGVCGHRHAHAREHGGLLGRARGGCEVVT
jgi:tetratricopeptide (TPR) repeat protein